jgi:hypothetical protein
VRMGGVCLKVRAWRNAKRPWALAVEDPQEMGKDIGSGSSGIRGRSGPRQAQTGRGVWLQLPVMVGVCLCAGVAPWGCKHGGKLSWLASAELAGLRASQYLCVESGWVGGHEATGSYTACWSGKCSFRSWHWMTGQGRAGV